jgi:probable addiction module antidote protein
MPVEYEPFDISEYLDSEERIAGVLSAAAEDEDPNVLLGALAHAAKARGMMQVARDAGLSRESLYKALKPGAHPRFETVQAVLRALGVKLSMKTAASTSSNNEVGVIVDAESRKGAGEATADENAAALREAREQMAAMHGEMLKMQEAEAARVKALEAAPRGHIGKASVSETRPKGRRHRSSGAPS